MAKSNLNISVILKHLDQHNLELYEAVRRDETTRKELNRILPYVLPLWVSGTVNGKDQIELMRNFNRHVNSSWLELADHPELQAKVLGAIGLGRVVRHDYHYREKRGVGDSLSDLLGRRYPDIRKEEIMLWCSKNSEDTLLKMCCDYGVQEEDCGAVIDSYRKVISR